MKKRCCVYLMGLILTSFVAQGSALTDGEAFKKALEQFNPSSALKDFTDTPKESYIKPSEHEDALKNQGRDVMQTTDALHEVYTSANTRTKAIPNPMSPEMRYADKLIETSERVKEGGCYEPPPVCTNRTTQQTCADIQHFSSETCGRHLVVKREAITHSVSRWILGLNLHDTIDLAQCDAGRTWDACTSQNEVHVGPDCQSVNIMAVWKGKPIDITHDQTCSHLSMTVKENIRGYGAELQITVIEHALKDIWEGTSCDSLQKKAADATCVFEKGDACLSPNATNMIDGVSVTRACWGEAMQYQCLTGHESTCENLQNCTQTLSTCVEQAFGVCVRFENTFECTKTSCIPQPEVCTPILPCTDGACDKTHAEESVDLGEGVSKLGAMVGTASDVALNQIKDSEPRIFEGKVMQCEKFMLNSRNCCSDSGWADWVIHCPQSMQELHKAKDENRVVYLGDYKDGLLDTDHHYVYCIFPSKLSSIMQIEGRLGQLHIPFGEPKEPHCGGISPLQLEHIDFGKLNLSPIEQDLINRTQTPDFTKTLEAQEAHVQQLNQEGKSHD